MKKITLVALIVASCSTNVLAEDSTSKINPWKHCGIGAMIFDDNTTAAAISNIIWDLGTTAISTRVSSEESCKGKRTEVGMFIQDNFDTVLEQTSSGNGEHLDAMLDILEVSDASKAEIIVSVRSAIDADTSPESYYNALIAAI